MRQATEMCAEQRSQQSDIRLLLGTILLGTIVALQAVASIALAGTIWP